MYSLYRKLLLALTGIFCLGILVNLISSEEDDWYKDFEKFSELNPQEVASMPKYDRPDLAALHDFEMTKDPSLGYPPVERLFDSYQYSRKLMSSKRAIDGVEWAERGPNNVGGRTRALMFDPNDPTARKVWAAGVSGGLWVNENITDPNSSWIKTNDFFTNIAVNSIAYDPEATNVFYFGTGEGWGNGGAVRGNGIWKSVDGGITWSQLESTMGSEFYYVQKIVVTDNSTLLVATRDNQGIKRSTDGGETWEEVVDAPRGADIEKAGPNIYATTGIFTPGKIWRSTDDGVSWNEITPNSGGERIELGVNPRYPNTVYAVASTGSNVAWMYKSSNAGESWSSLSIPAYIEQSCSAGTSDFSRGQAWYDLILAVHPSDPDVVIVGGIDLYRSVDGGKSWDLISYWTGQCDTYVHADQHNFQFRPGYPDDIIVSNDGGVYYSPNILNPSEGEGPSFFACNKDYNVAQFYACAARNEIGSDNFLAGAQDNGSHQFNKIGIGSTIEVTGGDGAFCFIDQNEGDIQITSYVYNSYYFTTDAWTSVKSAEADGGRFINPADYDSRSNTLFSAGAENKIVRYAIGDEIVSQEMNVSLGAEIASAITVSGHSENVIYVGTGVGNLYKVSNAQSTPSVVKLDNDNIVGYISCIAVGESDEQILVTVSNYGVESLFETRNGGDTWALKEGNLPDMPVRWALYNPGNYNEVLIATELGVWSTNEIDTEEPVWEPSNNGLANVRCDMLKYRDSDGMVVLATHGRGLFTSDIFAKEPIARFGLEAEVVFQGMPVGILDASLKATSYNWDFGNGIVSTDKSPEFSYSEGGDYTITLTINEDPALTYSQDIHVLSRQPTSYTLADGGNFEQNTDHFYPVTVSGTGFELGNSEVNGKSGTVSGDNAWVTGLSSATYDPYTEAYLYTPTFDFSLSGAYSLSFFTKYAIEDEWEGFVLEYSTDGRSWVKLGDFLDLENWYNQSAIGQAVVWAPGEPFFSGDTEDEFVFKTIDLSFLSSRPEVGFRFVFKSDPASEEAGIAIDDFTVSAPESTEPLIEFYAETSSLCVGREVVFYNESEGAIDSYVWNFGVDAIPSEATGFGPHSVRYTSGGQKQVTLAGIVSGESIEEIQTLELTSEPHEVSLNYIDNYCFGEPVIISLGEREEGVSYALINYTNDVKYAEIQAQEQFEVDTLSSGSYDFYLTAVNPGGCSVTFSEQVSFRVKLDYEIQISRVSSNELRSSFGDSYQWYLNGEMIEGAVSRNLTIDGPGVYSCEVVFDGCSFVSENFEFLVLGENDNVSLDLYPNPSTDFIRVNSSEFISKLQVFDQSGKRVTKVIDKVEPNYSIDISRWEAGLYFVNVEMEGKVITKRFVKQ